jgi:hypothetical protein
MTVTVGRLGGAGYVVAPRLTVAVGAAVATAHGLDGSRSPLRCLQGLPGSRTCCTSWPPLTRPSPRSRTSSSRMRRGTRTAGSVQPLSRPTPPSGTLDATGCQSPAAASRPTVPSTDPVVLSSSPARARARSRLTRRHAPLHPSDRLCARTCRRRLPQHRRHRPQGIAAPPCQAASLRLVRSIGWNSGHGAARLRRARSLRRERVLGTSERWDACCIPPPGSPRQVKYSAEPHLRHRSEATLDDEVRLCSRRPGGAYAGECLVWAPTVASCSSPSTTSSSFSATVARSVLLPVSGSVK